MSGRVWRGDLARVLLGLDGDRHAEAASLLGFSWSPPPKRVASRGGRRTVERPRSHEEGPANAPSPDVALWRAQRFEPTRSEIVVEEPPDTANARWTDDASVFDTPAPPPIAAWARLGAPLQRELRTMLPCAELDLDAIVRAWGRGEGIDPLPRLARRAWAGRVVVCLDRSRRLVPAWFDQEVVCHQLLQHCGEGSLEVRVVCDVPPNSLVRRTEIARVLSADPRVPVLVLGDLGFYAGPEARAAWREVARRLKRKGVAVAALVPVPPGRWHGATARAWNAIPWGVRDMTRGAASPEDRASNLLRLASPAAIVEPGLLRELRKALPASQADVSTEFDAWNHPFVRRAGVTGFSLQPEHATRLRAEFASLPEPTQRAVRDLIARWHATLPEELRHGEALAWRASASRDVDPPSDLQAALRYWRRLDVALRRHEGGGGAALDLRRYGRAHVVGLPGVIYEEFPWLRRVLRLTTAGADRVRVPVGHVPSAIGREGEPPRVVTNWGVRQVGGMLRIDAVEGTTWPAAQQGPGSPVAVLAATEPEVVITYEGEATGEQVLLRDGLAVGLQGRSAVTLASDRDVTEVRAAPMEPWMSATGRDAYGLWAEFAVGGVVQRLRWIPPGRFWMGSPETESGRDGDEGPRHEVVMTSGYWLGETPVTQGLWEAVTGSNPSRFKGADRPVERVSWEDCEGFMARLEEHVRGLGARFPTEAEWERACRGGTEGATWLGGHDVSTLNAAAWWRDNSGGETHPVRQKAANPYGLYDVLGNVWEWCADYRRPYESSAVRDPYGPTDGPSRVRRGGSWNSAARFVRAAFRVASHASRRADVLGFRLARGQGLRSSPGQQGAAERSGARTAGRGPGGASTRDAATPHDVDNPRRRSR